MTKPRTYTPELREEAVKRVLAQGLTLGEASKRIAIPFGNLAAWIKAAKRGNGSVTAPGSRTERDIVKMRQRTLRGSRCQVRGHEDLAARMSDCRSVSGTQSALQTAAEIQGDNEFESRLAGRRQPVEPDLRSDAAKTVPMIIES